MKTQNDFRESKKFAASTWLCILLAVILLTAYTVICALDTMYNELVGMAFLSVYLVAVAIMLFVNRRYSVGRRMRSRENIALSTAMSDLVQKINIPMAVTDKGGKMVWYNEEMFALSGRKRHAFGINISDICQLAPEELAKTNPEITPENAAETIKVRTEATVSTVDVGDMLFDVRSYEMRVVGKTYYLSVFSDVTELTRLKEKVEADTPVVAYVVIDNLEELAQYVRVSSREAANEAENVIKAWAKEINALVREYDRDKFILVFKNEMLIKCIENKFEILEINEYYV